MIDVRAQTLSELEAKLNARSIHELRQIARHVGVAHPTEGKKERIANEILAIAKGETSPVERKNLVGAPPKSDGYDVEVVDEILYCRQLYLYEPTASDGRAMLTVNASEMPEEYEVRGLFGMENGSGLVCVAGKTGYSSVAYVSAILIKRYNLRAGDMVCGIAKRRTTREFGGIMLVKSVNGNPPENDFKGDFESLTPVYPEKRLNLSRKGAKAGTAVDLFAPVGIGQRTLVTVPRGADRYAFLKEIALAAAEGGQADKVIFLMTDARPEDCAYMQSSLAGVEVIASAMEFGAEINARMARLALAHAKRIAGQGKNVVLVMDDVTAYARELNYRGANVAGELEISALDEVKKYLSSARNTAKGGTLTIVAAACAGETAFETTLYNNIKDAFNSYVVLSDEGSVDPSKSYNPRADKLLTAQECGTAEILRAKSGEEVDALLSEYTVAELCAKFKNK